VTPCSESSSAAAEPLDGTASQAADWLLVEHRGAWGRDAVRDSALPDEVATALEAFPGKVLLIRRPGRRERRPAVFRARATEDGGELTRHRLPGLEALADGAALDRGTALSGPLVLVCAHGRRDACCARLGIPVFDALREHVPQDRLWQSSHQGGHRFAANLLVLPWGVHLGRVDARDAARVSAMLREDRIPLDHYRGRAAYPAAVQAAEIAVRRERGIDTVRGVHLRAVEDGRVTFELGGERLTVSVEQRPGPAVPLSCGAEPEPTSRYIVSF
jgi:hypothetical protein